MDCVCWTDSPSGDGVQTWSGCIVLAAVGQQGSSLPSRLFVEYGKYALLHACFRVKPRSEVNDLKWKNQQPNWVLACLFWGIHQQSPHTFGPWNHNAALREVPCTTTNPLLPVVGRGTSHRLQHRRSAHRPTAATFWHRISVAASFQPAGSPAFHILKHPPTRCLASVVSCQIMQRPAICLFAYWLAGALLPPGWLTLSCRSRACCFAER
jgi:hypothetical protein